MPTMVSCDCINGVLGVREDGAQVSLRDVHGKQSKMPSQHCVRCSVTSAQSRFRPQPRPVGTLRVRAREGAHQRGKGQRGESELRRDATSRLVATTGSAKAPAARGIEAGEVR
jgi:hypothetical protein